VTADEELERDVQRLLALRDRDAIEAQNEIDLNDDACAAECDGVGASRRALWKFSFYFTLVFLCFCVCFFSFALSFMT
jgi:nuclear pore complex protein Nup107